MIFASILQSYEANVIGIYVRTVTLTYDLISGESAVSLKMTVNFFQEIV